MTTHDFSVAFDHLKRILESYQDRLVLKQDTPQAYALDTPYAEQWERELFFGSVEIKRLHRSNEVILVQLLSLSRDLVCPPDRSGSARGL